MTKSMHAPWRMAYIQGEKPAGCVFCKDSIRQDDLILLEGKTAFVMLNRYPYISGHLMVIPYRHVQRIEDLHSLERSEALDLIDISVRSLKEVMRPEGFNIGMNLGKAAGAGVDDHIHVHVIPRWVGDTNFMPVIGRTKVQSVPLDAVYERLRNEFVEEFGS